MFKFQCLRTVTRPITQQMFSPEIFIKKTRGSPQFFVQLLSFLDYSLASCLACNVYYVTLYNHSEKKTSKHQLFCIGTEVTTSYANNSSVN